VNRLLESELVCKSFLSHCVWMTGYPEVMPRTSFQPRGQLRVAFDMLEGRLPCYCSTDSLCEGAIPLASQSVPRSSDWLWSLRFALKNCSHRHSRKPKRNLSPLPKYLTGLLIFTCTRWRIWDLRDRSSGEAPAVIRRRRLGPFRLPCDGGMTAWKERPTDTPCRCYSEPSPTLSWGIGFSTTKRDSPASIPGRP
jgi:hypothetical protein